MKAACTKSGSLTTPKSAREVWRKIPSFPGYEASNLGRVRSRSVRLHVLKTRRNYATLKEDATHVLVSIGNRKRLVHRLVDEAFRGPRPPKMIVHHRDNDMTNNRLVNLQRVTHSQNTLYAYRDGRIGLRYKLNPFQRAKAVELYRTGKYTVLSLSKLFRVHRGTMRSLLHKAGIKPNGMRKLTPAIYREIRHTWVPYKVSASMLASRYGVSRGMIEYILGMRASRRGKRLPKVSA